MERLPIYFMLDLSGSMANERIEAVKVVWHDILTVLHRLECHLGEVVVSLVTFGAESAKRTPLLPLATVGELTVNGHFQGCAELGAALFYLARCITDDQSEDVAEGRIAAKPLVFLITDGEVTDLAVFRKAVEAIKLLPLTRLTVLRTDLGYYERELDRLTRDRVRLGNLDLITIKGLFLPVVPPAVASLEPAPGEVDSMCV